MSAYVSLVKVAFGVSVRVGSVVRDERNRAANSELVSPLSWIALMQVALASAERRVYFVTHSRAIASASGERSPLVVVGADGCEVVVVVRPYFAANPPGVRPVPSIPALPT